MLALMASGGIAIVVAVLLTPVLISWFKSRPFGQPIREDGPASHLVKAGTPTMGGIAIVVAVITGFIVAHLTTSILLPRSGILVLGTIVCFAAIGFLDDLIKVRNRRSLGLNKRSKSGGQLLVAVVFAFLAVHWVGVQTTLSFTRFDSPGWQLGQVGWMLLAVFVLIGTSNAVNLADGLDGLAAGSATECLAVLSIIGYWQFRHYAIYHVGDLHVQGGTSSALDLALVAIGLAGGCLGFLWWNAAPAKIYMGDTGSLAIGSGLAALCLLMNLDLLLVIIGALYVVETLSVIIQVFSFRVFHRRVFKIAPIHHHFELMGWPETTVIIRFWILSALCAALGLGIFYGDFLHVTKGL